MEIVIALIIAWAVITVVGHVSWVIVRAFFRLFSDADPLRPPINPVIDGKADIHASRRVINRMVRENVLDPMVAEELRAKLRDLEHGNFPTRQAPREIPSVPPSVESVENVKPAIASTDAGERVDDIAPALEPGSVSVNDVTDDQPLLATLVSEPESSPSPFSFAPPSASPTEDAVEPQPKAPPILSRSEVIQSFLAAHNIRWGELAAGMLIVGCSIGLVITLWSTLVDTHRVIPSLIFLGANAAVYAAGLYTLSRWRLRHTSRAVLAIATLLVPLSVLAGLAAAGTGIDAVQLNDPITLAAIALAGMIYISLLYSGGKALAGRLYAAAIALAVAGPVSILPLVPASVRVFGSSAGWILLVGSIAVLVASVQQLRLRQRKSVSLGVAGGRARLLVIGFAGFSLVMSIGYTAFKVQGFADQGMLPIAIAIIPALIALAASSRALMTTARSSTQSMTGAVLCPILIALAWTILPATMIAQQWVWYWGIVFSGSALVVGWLAGQPRWLALAALPAGMAATLSSPVWLGGESWADVALWQRFFGGEPMLAASMVAVLVGLASQVTRDPLRRTAIQYAAIFWSCVAMAIAAGLSIAPDDALSIAPRWSVSCVLALGVAVSIVLATRHHAWSWATIGATIFTWLSIFRPIQWTDLELASPTLWMKTIAAIAVTMLVFGEMVPRLLLRTSRQARIALRSAKNWQIGSIAASIVAGAIACLSVQNDWSDSAMTLACVSALLFWASTASRSIDLLRVSQLATVALFVVIGYGQFREWLFTAEAWTIGTATWAWALLVGTVAGLWLSIRQIANLNHGQLKSRGVHRRLQHLRSSQAALALMPDGWLVTLATALAALGSLWAYAALLSRLAGNDVVPYGFDFALPAAALLVCGIVVGWTQLKQHDFLISEKLAASLFFACVIWGSSQLAHIISDDAATALIIATTMAAAACLALPKWVLPRLDESLSGAVEELAIVVAPLLVAISSAVLLLYGWLEPIDNGDDAHALETIAVAAWWMIAAAGLLWKSKQKPDSAAAIVSAVLAPAAAILMVPVFSLSDPPVWIQVAGTVSVMWVAISRYWLRDDRADAARSAIDGSMWFAFVIGIVSSVLVTLSIVLDIQSLDVFCGPAGLLISVLSAVLWSLGWVHLPNQSDATDNRLLWPLALTMLAGQVAWLAETFQLAAGDQVIEMIAAIWCIASLASLVAYRRDAKHIDFIHIGLVSVANTIICGVVSQSELLPLLALAALAIGGLAVALVGNDPRRSAPWLGASRLLGWFVVVAGGVLLIGRIAEGMSPHQHWTILVVWSAAWIVGWRLASPEHKADSDKRRAASLAIPDTELAIGLLIAVVSETILFTLSGRQSFLTGGIADPLLWTRVAAYVAVGMSTLARAHRDHVWTIATGTLVAATSLVSVQISIHFDATLNQRFMWAMLPGGFVIAFISHWLPMIARLLGQIAGGSLPAHLERLIRATWQVSLVIASLGGLSAAMMILGGAPAAEIQLTIVAVALAAWAIAEMAESCDGARLRHAAISVALISIGLWASVDSGETSHPLLSASMRWLVASVFTIPMVLFVFPKLFGQSMSARWSDAFRRGAGIAGIAAGCSLISMLVMEATIRSEGGIDEISWALVIGVAVTLAILSGLAGLIAIQSGPGFSLRERLKLSDQQRVQLIIAAQVIGAITWLHVFLCKNWSLFGLRNYWPYIVMALAFVSVGATQWARRRKDEVMSKTLSQTALYLPLIPVVGFWLSGSLDGFDWVFKGGKVRYDLLLAIGSAYYIGISALWKGAVPRISAIVLGNAAWWVVLVQQADWGFVMHPQVWLIPPAVCVLVVAHMYRDRLEPTTASAIRYAATLVIYISSTADLLLQEIGTNIWGPIVLVSLALTGMAAGVVLRVRPFLYLGAMFVFLGVTSMVWHAHEAIDAVWPWWVFGITTGILLLAGLMAIEKNKPRLRQYANSLATWQG